MPDHPAAALPRSDGSRPAQPWRAGTAAIVGRSNVGKSTLLNAALELELAIVSRHPQTTRDPLLGLVRHGGSEIGLLDTPGLHRARTRLGETMNRIARRAARQADVVVYLVGLPRHPEQRTLAPHPGDLGLIEQLPEATPTVLAINMIDRLRDKRQLLPLIAAFAELGRFGAVVPISALRADGICRVLDEVAPLLPEGPARHDADDITDRPLAYFAAAYVREAVMEATRQEVPHAAAVRVDRFVEPLTDGPLSIDATILVERGGHKPIVVGAGGSMLRRIGERARHRIEALSGRQAVLKLWVAVARGWRDDPQQLAELGYREKKGTG